MARKAKSFIFPVVAWDDIEGKDVWVGDVVASQDCPLVGKYENEDIIATLESDFGQCYVVRSAEIA